MKREEWHRVIMKIKRSPRLPQWLSGKESSCCAIPWRRKLATHSSILAWEIPWWWCLVGYNSPWGHKRFGYNLATKQQQISFQKRSNAYKVYIGDEIHTFILSTTACHVQLHQGWEPNCPQSMWGGLGVWESRNGAEWDTKTISKRR